VCACVCVCVLSPSTWTRTQGFAVVSRAGYTRTATHSEVWTEAALCPSVCQAICLLPAARMLAALSDGAISLMDVDTLQVIQMPAIKVHPPPPLLPVQFACEAPRPVAMVWFSRRGRRTRLRRPLPPSPPNMACMGSFIRSSFNNGYRLGCTLKPGNGHLVGALCVFVCGSGCAGAGDGPKARRRECGAVGGAAEAARAVLCRAQGRRRQRRAGRHAGASATGASPRPHELP